jgi:hypothetical protein
LEFRHHNNAKAYNPYFDPLGMAKTDYVKAFCEDAKEFWIPEKWGDCNGELQLYRKTVKYATPPLPEKKC